MFRVVWLGCVVWIVQSLAVFAQEPTLLLKVKSSFDRNEMSILEVNRNGPAARLSNDQVSNARLEAGDVIVAIDGIQIRNRQDFVRAMNHSVDGYVRLSVRDVNSGQVVDWWTNAAPSASDPYRAAMDACSRAINSNAVSIPKFSFEVHGDLAAITLGSTIQPIHANDVGVEESLRELMVGFLVVKQNAMFRNVVGNEALLTCDRLLQACFMSFRQTDQVEQRREIVKKASEETLSLLQSRLADWAQKNGIKFATEATLPTLVNFRINNPVSGSTVQILSVADQMLMLCTLRTPDRFQEPLTARELEVINNSMRWTSLPDDNASAYGRFYYRFVNGTAARPLDEYSPRRQIVITPSVVKDGAITFRP